MSIDTGVVLAAGEGKRLRPLTRHRPKPMLPAADRPIIEHVFDGVLAAGVSELHVVVGYGRDRIREHVGSTYRDVPVTYHVQEKQLGSGHALLQAQDAIDERFLVANGDQVVDPSLVEDVADAADRSDATATLGVVERADAARYGAIHLRDGLVTDLVERPHEGEYRLLNAGVYAFDPSVFDAIEDTPRERGSIHLPSTIARLVEDDLVAGVRTDGYWTDATYPWDLLSVARQLLRSGRVDPPKRADGVWVADSATVHERATLRPPVVVSADCQIAPNAVVGPNVAVRRYATIDAGAVVRDSVVDDDARIGAGSVVVDSVLGQGVSLGPGSTIPGGTADVRVNDRIHEGRQLGAVFADRAVATGDVSCRPGVLVGPDATIGTGVTLDDNVPADAEVRR